MLLINNLTKVYNELSADTRVVALKNITLTLPDTGLVVIVGKSGCGKTTLLNILCGIDQPSYGRVICDGEEVDYTSNFELDYYRSRTTSVVFQDYNLMHDYNVIENVKLGLRLQGKEHELATQVAKDALTAVGLEKYAYRKVSTLSGGQQQRVAIARAIAKDSKIVFCDEPTGNLDSTNAKEVFSFLKMCARSRLFVVVTHDENLATIYADRIIRMADGDIVSDTVDDNAYRQKYAPFADEIFAIDERMGDGERVARSLKKGVSTSSKFIKKNLDKAFTTMYNESVLSNSLNKSFRKSSQDLRLIGGKLKEGASIAFDSLHQKNIKNKNSPRAKVRDKKISRRGYMEQKQARRVHGLSFSNIMLIIKNNIAKSWLFNCAIIIVLILAFSLFSVFLSLNFYSGSSALIQTLQKDNIYILPITKYIDEPIITTDTTTGSQKVTHGPEYKYNQASLDDYEQLQQLVPQGLSVGYTWVKNLQDFFDKQYSVTKNSFGATNFNEVIVITDFSRLGDKLLYGQLPTQQGEVLIYDYMAYSLTSFGKFVDGQIEDVVGQQLTDQQSGISITISGILRSNYQQYSYLQNSTTSSNKFEYSYLAGLQSVFCSQQTADILFEDSLQSFISATLSIKNESGVQQQKTLQDKKLNNLNSLDGHTVLYSNPVTSSGLYISRQYACQLLGVDSSQLADHLDRLFGAQCQFLIVVPSNNAPNTYQTTTLPIAGVLDTAVSNSGVLNYYLAEEDSQQNASMVQNGQFRMYYYALSSDWASNATQINSLWQEKKSDDFYKQYPDYQDEGYMECSLYGTAIRDANYYLVKVRSLANNVMLILLIVVAIFIVIYTSYNLKKYNYKIAVLKALGANTKHILTIFTIQLVLIALFAFIIAVPSSYGIMAIINKIFVENFAGQLVFFAINGYSLLVTFMLAIFGVLAIAILPLLYLSTTSPMSVMRKSKRAK